MGEGFKLVGLGAHHGTWLAFDASLECTKRQKMFLFSHSILIIRGFLPALALANEKNVERNSESLSWFVQISAGTQKFGQAVFSGHACVPVPEIKIQVVK